MYPSSAFDDADLELMLREEFDQPSTVMIEYVGADSLLDLCQWANGLAGQRCADYPRYDITRVVQFQFVPNGGRFDCVVLVEVQPR